MRAAGAQLLDELTRAAAIGPFDAARHLGTLRRARGRLEAHLRAECPDLAVLVDFGDYNLPVMAPLLKRFGVPIAYYISPQLWAWGRWRLRYVRRYVDRMLVLFRFEEAFYKAAEVPVTWVGHPLVDAARPTRPREEALRGFGLNPWRMTVGLLPGSREAEVRRHLPVMLAAAREMAWRMPGLQFLLVPAPGVDVERLRLAAARAEIDLHLAENPAPAEAFQVLEGALVASGTATLQLALAHVPMAVVYRTSWPTYVAARCVVRIPRIAMVNVVAQRPVVPEFVQHLARPGRIAESALTLLRDQEARQRMLKGLAEVAEALGPPGAIERAAEAVLELLRAGAGTSSARSR
jgi:lipid-A-disaccharide synthase